MLTQWIARLGGQNGYRAQATSVPGVAQRTGATIYYVEMTPWVASDPEPILSLMPTAGDVDVVLASELMEAGRAMIRNLVSADRTTLISSTHRIYAISEKTVRGNGIANGDTVISAAQQRAKRFIRFDMAEASHQAGCAISAVMFGALAGSGALPFPRAAYIEAIRSEGKASAANLAGFEAGFRESQDLGSEPASAPQAPITPTTEAGRALATRILTELPSSTFRMAVEGVRRLLDYQDYAYASLYLDRLVELHGVDSERSGWRLTREAARYLALWMAYDDTIRVADLKIRDTRMKRVRSEVGASNGQLVNVTEFMHPRFRELCDTLPRRMGRRLLHSTWANRILGRFFAKGRFIETTSLVGFAVLALLASLRRWRRSTLRYAEEQARILTWLKLIQTAARDNADAAVEIIQCQRLIKGYGDTYANGLAAFDRIIAAYVGMKDEPDVASRIRGLREAALGSG